jgi:hypothetical protein
VAKIEKDISVKEYSPGPNNFMGTLNPLDESPNKGIGFQSIDSGERTVGDFAIQNIVETIDTNDNPKATGFDTISGKHMGSWNENDDDLASLNQKNRGKRGSQGGSDKFNYNNSWTENNNDDVYKLGKSKTAHEKTAPSVINNQTENNGKEKVASESTPVGNTLNKMNSDEEEFQFAPNSDREENGYKEKGSGLIKDDSDNKNQNTEPELNLIQSNISKVSRFSKGNFRPPKIALR